MGGETRPRALDTLRDARFRLLWIGQSVSSVGSATTLTALTLALVDGPDSAGRIGVVLGSGLVSEAVFLLVGGVLADRLPRRLIMLAADAVRCAGHVLMGLLLLGDGFSLAAVALLSAVTGAAGGFFRPASVSVVPSTVTAEHLQSANALLAVARRLAMLLGPALATTLVLTVGVGWALVLDGVTFALSCLTLALLRLPEQRSRTRGSFTRDLREGWDEVRTRTWLWTNLTAHGLWNLARTIYFTAGATLVITRPGGEWSWGLVVQGGAVGAVAGALLALRVRPRRPLRVANLCLAVGGLPLALIAIEANVWVIVVAAAAMNTGLAVMSALWDTAIQRHVPDTSLARVGAIDWLLSTALAPLGMVAAGPLAQRFGAASALGVAAGVMTVSCLLVAVVVASPGDPGAEAAGSGAGPIDREGVKSAAV
ncbi:MULTISPECIES: MFS transporter [Streptomyces]|uniref:MFS transporter n=1 Tax=Streptomyces TaxID=1883 RepID=UPI00093EE4CB|nr:MULTISPECIES: MFS transporter [unclassified Streptomyces]OKJ13232.1 hypothetical protein AMK20_13045 [Streptomyces sp. TSRI0261]QNQ37259.1 MFS transporter [Streptomyces sp. CB00271]